MVMRIIAVAFVAAAALLSGCGADTAPAPAPTSTVSDEDQIRDAIARVSEAQDSGDVDDVAALTCAKYRDQVSVQSPSPDDVPPMNALPLDMFSTLPPEKLVEALGAEYAGASEASGYLTVGRSGLDTS